MTKVISIVPQAGMSAAEFLRAVADELETEADPTTKLCVVITTYADDGMLRLRAQKHNANALEVQGMLSLATVDYANQD